LLTIVIIFHLEKRKERISHFSWLHPWVTKRIKLNHLYGYRNVNKNRLDNIIQRRVYLIRFTWGRMSAPIVHLESIFIVLTHLGKTLRGSQNECERIGCIYERIIFPKLCLVLNSRNEIYWKNIENEYMSFDKLILVCNIFIGFLFFIYKQLVSFKVLMLRLIDILN